MTKRLIGAAKITGITGGNDSFNLSGARILINIIVKAIEQMIFPIADALLSLSATMHLILASANDIKSQSQIG